MMGIFDKVAQDDFDSYKNFVQGEFRKILTEIQQQRNSIQNQFAELKSSVEANATISDEEAKKAAESAILSQANIKVIEEEFSGVLEEINRLHLYAKDEVSKISTVKSEFDSKNIEFSNVIVQAQQYFSDFLNKKNIIDSSSATIAEKVLEFNSYLERSKDLPNSLEETKNVLAECKKLTDSIQLLLNHSLKKKAEIDDLYKDIYGEDISNSDGAVEHTSGLKDELESSYADLLRDVTSLENTTRKSISDALIKFDEALQVKRNEFEIVLAKSSERFQAVDTQLTGLLPGGMAAGLSAAYEEKKHDEIKSLKSFDSSFRYAIAGMVIISSIPLGINIYLLVARNLDLVKILKDTPTIILAILPLYFPVLWLAYSSNKKSNLSKRLIEEYTHKSVLGKTFSGLSNQIETLQQKGAVQEELRTKLLFNILQVSAENPGKLITNYSKSDHPLMDALENSAKLADSVNALSKIPGFSAIANKLAKKTNNLLKENEKRVASGLETQEAMDGSDVEDDVK